jgi:hypothetical protein
LTIFVPGTTNHVTAVNAANTTPSSSDCSPRNTRIAMTMKIR